MTGAVPLAFCGDDALGYARSRSAFAAGAGFGLDEGYRLAHLPLVAPGHPRAIATKAGTHYAQGRHPEIFSLVMPVAATALEAAPAYRALERALRDAPFGPKIAWDIVAARRQKLHATLCSALGLGTVPAIGAETRDKLAAIGPFAVRLGGLFSGNVNRGRLYLKTYPESRAGHNVVQEVQQALGRPKGDLYVVGVWNLTDDLDAEEASALEALIAAWWDRPILDLIIDRLWLMGARDDLVLDSRVVETIPLGP